MRSARLVGLTVQSWTPEGEFKEDYYGRLPIKVAAFGTWAQTGEFFRRVSELDRIVSGQPLDARMRTTMSCRPTATGFPSSRRHSAQQLSLETSL